MKKHSFKILLLSLVLLVSSCMSTEEKKKKAEEEGNALVAIKSKMIKGAGDALKSDGKEAVESATEGIGEVIKGISSGYDKSINQAKVVADSTFKQTFNIGRTEKIYKDNSEAKKVTVYLIARQNFNGKVKLKAFDESKTEIGRSSLDITISEDDAKYFDFEFDNRTPLLKAAYFIITKKEVH